MEVLKWEREEDRLIIRERVHGQPQNHGIIRGEQAVEVEERKVAAMLQQQYMVHMTVRKSGHFVAFVISLSQKRGMDGHSFAFTMP